MASYRGKLMAVPLLSCLGLIISGCSTQEVITPNTTSSLSSANAISNIVTDDKLSNSPNGTTDTGRIVSLTPIDVPNLQPGLIAYRMMYWSNSVKVEALMAVPKDITTPVPLNVYLHGGWDAPQNLTHDSPFEDGAHHTDNQTADVKWLGELAAPTAISIVPLYQGYGESDGTVQGIDVNTVNTNDLIKIILTKYKVIPNRILLYGVSMGGAVALKVASIRTDISTVVANSPFVGWDIVGQWATQNPNTPLGKRFLKRLATQYGQFAPNSPKLKKVSVDYENISAPVLLLQGKKDTYVPWQTVQMLYEDMKRVNKDVTLEMFPDGTHGLYDVTQASNDVFHWFNRYGAYSQ